MKELLLLIFRKRFSLVDVTAISTGALVTKDHGWGAGIITILILVVLISFVESILSEPAE